MGNLRQQKLQMGKSHLSLDNIAELKTIKQKVEAILAENPKARDDYTYLCWIFCIRYAGMKSLPLEEFKKLMGVSFESITRAARIIQNTEGKFPPSPGVRAQRDAKREDYRTGIHSV